jgi:hypothetical protein
MKITALPILGLLFLAGCGIAAKVHARDNMEASLAAYKGCLTQHPSDVSQCEGYRLAYQADLQAYRATAAGIQPGTNSTLNIHTGND